MKTGALLTFLTLLLTQTCNTDNKSQEVNSGGLTEQSSNSSLSAYSNLFVKELNDEIEKSAIGGEFEPSKNLVEKFDLLKLGSAYYVGAMMKVEGTVNESDLGSLGIKIGTKAGDIWTVKIPILKIEETGQISGITLIKIDEPVTN